MTENTNENETAEERQTPTEELPDPIENNLADEVLVDNPAKVAHEDQVPETQRQLEENETRDGRDFEGQPSARELRDQRAEEAENDEGR